MFASLKSCFSCCRSQQSKGIVVTDEEEEPVRDPKSLSRLQREKILGIVLLTLGILMVALAAILASGVFGSSMYFVSGGFAIASIVPFLLAAYFLTKTPPEMKGSAHLFLSRTDSVLDAKSFQH